MLRTDYGHITATVKTHFGTCYSEISQGILVMFNFRYKVLKTCLICMKTVTVVLYSYVLFLNHNIPHISTVAVLRQQFCPKLTTTDSQMTPGWSEQATMPVLSRSLASFLACRMLASFDWQQARPLLQELPVWKFRSDLEVVHFYGCFIVRRISIDCLIKSFQKTELLTSFKIFMK